MLGKSRVKNTNNLLVGEWIILHQNSDFFKGFVTRINESINFGMFCIGYYNKQGKFIIENKEYSRVSTISGSYTIYRDEEPRTLKDVEDKRHILDIAIDTQDEDWFRELVN